MANNIVFIKHTGNNKYDVTLNGTSLGTFAYKTRLDDGHIAISKFLHYPELSDPINSELKKELLKHL